MEDNEDRPVARKLDEAAWERYLETSQDIGAVEATVCLTHLRFIPCRKGYKYGDCVFSSDPEDIQAVYEHHHR